MRPLTAKLKRVNEQGAWEAMDDEQIVAALRANDRAAFDELYRRYQPVVEAVCRRRLWDRQIAEEAIQDTFVALYRRLARFRGGALLGRYVLATARGVALDAGERAAQARRTELRALDSDMLVQEAYPRGLSAGRREPPRWPG